MTTADSLGAAPDQPSVAKQLNRSRHDLLDLTLRNSLLNFRPSRTRGLRIIDEVPRETFRILVRDRRAMSFRPARTDIEASTRDDQELPEGLLSLMAADDATEQPADRHVDTQLQTPYEKTQLDIRLRNTFRFAHTSIEEQGVNILYLALGMLRWYESESSEEPRIAPLVLVPAALSRSDARARFSLTPTDEDIAANLSLSVMLKQDFGIGLPELGDMENIDVDDYFRRVARTVTSQERWSVDASAIYLGFFSFNKLLIFRDLDPLSWPEDNAPADHAIVQTLFGVQGFREPDPSIADDDHLDDHLDVSDTHQVVDSDSSQTLAVIDVKNGRNLVIQGPPGTGKSQTITNLIAEAIADDRRVLFVAEKMAALEVVKRRLDEIQIGDACLELHSHKANKRAMLNELKRTLDLGKPRLSDPAEDRSLLRASRTRLNDYCRAVNTPIGKSGVSPHDIVGRLEQLERSGPTKWPPIQLDGASSWTRAEFAQRREQVEGLRALVSVIGPPSEHTFWISGRRSLLPMERSAIAHALEEAADAASRLQATLTDLRRFLRLESKPDSTEAMEALLRSVLRAAAAPNLDGVDHRHAAWTTHADALGVATQAIVALSNLHDNYDRLLTPTAWEADVEAYRQPVRTWDGRWWRFVSGSYRRACAGLRELCQGALPADGATQIAIIEAILEARRLRATVDESRDPLSRVLPDSAVDGDAATRRAHAEAASWLIELHGDKTTGTLDDSVHDVLDRAADRTALTGHADRCRSAMEAFSGALDAVAAQLEVRPDRFSEGRTLPERRFSELKVWLERADKELDTLSEVVRFNQQEVRLAEDGLGAVVEAALTWKDAGTHLTALFEHTWLTALMTMAFRDNPSLAEFDGNTHQQIIERFRQLDLDLFRHNRALVAEAHWRRLPRGPGGGQIGVLRREFEKKRRHLPIRKLMAEAGNAILQIKPVFMMSPLSIAKFVPPGSIRFDLVVFDEASQVRPVDALGAILRAGQAVVVGDSRQLPPTSFFDRLADENADTEETTATADLESILGMFCAAGAPERMLRWHYRSRHESLIAVSNHEFYDNRLVLFPSPDAKREETGLRFHHGAGTCYERGARKRFNAGEAGVVADAVMEHARRRPDLTLGVAAFSLSQARRIEDEVELRRREDPSTESFFAGHREEPFFVKNLENVQGDERDVMLISVGYGKMEGGYMPMNFGPLNQDGGERRLNVLITRARRRLEVHANFVADDLDLDRTGARGIEALKTFLKYAETGILDVPKSSGPEADSPFEEAVADALRTQGHTIAHQVGSAGFFIDLAVVETRPGRYLLGIECDGATYHSARSARDRDRLRQQVLEGLGWTIHRIWSTDWFMRRKRELEKVEAAIKRAKATESPAPDLRPRSRHAPIQRVDGGTSKADEPGRPYDVAKPDVQLGFHEFHEVADEVVLEWIRQVVQVEGPVHVEETALRIANAAGLQRAGTRIRARVSSLARRGDAGGLLRIKGSFLWRADQGRLGSFRRRDGDLPGRLRRPDMIVPEEIGAALRHAVQASYGIDADDAVTEASRLFGFKRAGKEIRTMFDTVLDTLVQGGEIEKRDNQLRFVSQGDGGFGVSTRRMESDDDDAGPVDSPGIPDRRAVRQVVTAEPDAERVDAGEEDEDPEIREMARHMFRRNVDRRQEWYDEQRKAKRYMAGATNEELAYLARREYPTDYEMQQHTYDEQRKAKRYMAGATNEELAYLARREYPTDYEMQKTAYQRHRRAKRRQGRRDG